MYTSDRKYIHITIDDFEAIGYVDDYQPDSPDLVFITIISDRKICPNSQWSSKNRDIEMGIDLCKTKGKWKFYEDYEEFFTEFFDAIL